MRVDNRRDRSASPPGPCPAFRNQYLMSSFPDLQSCWHLFPKSPGGRHVILRTYIKNVWNRSLSAACSSSSGPRASRGSICIPATLLAPLSTQWRQCVRAPPLWKLSRTLYRICKSCLQWMTWLVINFRGVWMTGRRQMSWNFRGKTADKDLTLFIKDSSMEIWSPWAWQPDWPDSSWPPTLCPSPCPAWVLHRCLILLSNNDFRPRFKPRRHLQFRSSNHFRLRSRARNCFAPEFVNITRTHFWYYGGAWREELPAPLAGGADSSFFKIRSAIYHVFLFSRDPKPLFMHRS